MDCNRRPWHLYISLIVIAPPQVMCAVLHCHDEPSRGCSRSLPHWSRNQHSPLWDHGHSDVSVLYHLQVRQSLDKVIRCILVFGRHCQHCFRFRVYLPSPGAAFRGLDMVGRGKLGQVFAVFQLMSSLTLLLVFATDPIMTGIIGGSVQLFFAWRIYVLLKNLFVVATVVLLSLAGILGSIGATIAVTIIPQFVKFQKFEVIVIIWLACAACADVIIALALVLHLRNKRNAFPGTNDVIDRLIRITMQTGLITSMCAVIDLITYLTISSGIHLIFNVPLAKLYSNSLLSSLNARGGWRYNTPDISSSLHYRQTTQQGTVQLQSGVHPEVFMHIEEHELLDGDKSQDLFGNAQSEAWSHQSKDGPVDV